MAAAQKVPPSVVATAASIPPAVLATAKTDATQLANAQKFAPELAVIQANPALFAKLATYTNPAKIPPALVTQAIKAAGGGAKGLGVLTTINANKAAIAGVIAAAPALKTVAPYAAQLKTIAPYSAELTIMAPYSAPLTALSKVPPGVFAYLNAHGAAVTKAAAQTASQWKTWYWICFGGIIFFLLSIPLLRGRWRTRDAKRDEAEHEAMVDAEMASSRPAPDRAEPAGCRYGGPQAGPKAGCPRRGPAAGDWRFRHPACARRARPRTGTIPPA